MKPAATPYSVARDLGISEHSLQRYGDFAVKIDHHLGRTEFSSDGQNHPSLINVTAVTPTVFGEGKTTVVIGLVDALRLRGQQAVGTIRQSSLGPTFNLKGAGIGGGKTQCVPRLPLILGMTGDMERVAQAQNLGMTALTARSIHESMYGDNELAEKGIRRLRISEKDFSQKWSLDFCAQSLRKIKLGLYPPGQDPNTNSGFVMTAATEVMTIFSLAQNLAEMRKMLGKMEFAKNDHGHSITADDLEVGGAMAVLLQSAFDPNLVLSEGGSPILVHGGPFANISVGNSSVISDLVASSFAKMIVTESGFGADVGYEKMWNIKSQRSPLVPKVAVLVVTVRALKFLGRSAASAPQHTESASAGMGALRAGFANLDQHLRILKISGVVPVVCINRFAEDLLTEVQAIQDFCTVLGVKSASSEHFRLGGSGALDLADLVIDACRGPFRPLKSLFSGNEEVKEKVLKIVRSVYGFETVTFSESFNMKLSEEAGNRDLSTYNVCMCKTPYSFSHDPKKSVSVPSEPFQVTGVDFHHGAELVIPICGSASFMPGTVSKPIFKQMDIAFPGEEIIGL
jgi:formate--tetrahydrofolate ligase